MIRAYKFKINPTVKQQHQLLQSFGCARFIYNWGLDLKIKSYKESNKLLSYLELAKMLTDLKKNNEYKWLNNVTNESLQQSLRNLETAYSNFFRTKQGFPKFKSKRNSKDIVKYINNVKFDFDQWKVWIPKCSWVKLCKNKSFDLSQVKLGTLTVTRDRCGEFWCSIVVNDHKEMKPKAKVSSETAVGIDMGIKDYIILSNGIKISNPKFYENTLKRLAVFQRRFARTQKGSHRHEIARIKLARQ